MADPYGSGYGFALSRLGNLREGMTNNAAGSALARGDYGGAAKTMFQGGDISGGFGIQDRQASQQEAARRARVGEEATAAAKQKELTGRALNVAKSIRAVPPGQRNGLYETEAVPVLRELQIPEQAITQVLADGRLTDEELDGFIVKLGGVLEAPAATEQYTLGPGSRRYDANGRLIAETPFAPQYRSVGEGQSLIEVNPAAPQGVAEPDIGSVELAVLEIPGTAVTGRARTPDRNAEVGGVENSYHLTGQARDFRIPQGMSAEQFAAQVQQKVGPGWEVIPEPNAPGGPHVHVEPAGRQAGGARVIARGAPKSLTPGQRMADERFQATQQRQGKQDARQLRKDFEALPDVKNFREIANSYEQVKKLGASGTAADDMAMTFGFMKMLDPTSVVREGEYALVGRAQGLTGRALVALQKIDSGQALTPDLRRELTATAKRVFDTRLARYKEIENQFRGYAEEDGIDPDRVTPAFQGGASDAPATPVRPKVIADPLWRTATPQQQAYWNASPPTGERGKQANPIRINPLNPTQSYNNIPKGAHYLLPNGEVRVKR